MQRLSLELDGIDFTLEPNGHSDKSDSADCENAQELVDELPEMDQRPKIKKSTSLSADAYQHVLTMRMGAMGIARRHSEIVAQSLYKKNDKADTETNDLIPRYSVTSDEDEPMEKFEYQEKKTPAIGIGSLAGRSGGRSLSTGDFKALADRCINFTKAITSKK